MKNEVHARVVASGDAASNPLDSLKGLFNR